MKRRMNSTASKTIVFVRIVFPLKVDLAVFQLEQSSIRDGDPMRIPGQVLQDLLRPAERWLGVDNPFSLTQFVDPTPKNSRIGQVALLTVEREFPSITNRSEQSQELAPKHAAQNTHGQEEPRSA